MLGRTADAMTCHRRGVRQVARKPHEFNVAAAHIDFLCLTANADAAVPLYEKFLPAATNSPDIARRFTYHLSGLLLATCLLRDGISTLKLRLPQEILEALPGSPQSPEPVEVAHLLNWGLKQCGDLADAFDARNGTPHHRNRLADHLAMPEAIRPWPLRTSGTGESKSTSKHE